MRILTLFFILLVTNIFSQIDTLKIASGKPYCLLIDVPKEGQSMGDNTDEKELKKNFKDTNLEVLLIKEHLFVLFENGQSIDFTPANNYNALIFWGGKLADNLKGRDGNFQNATEFVAKEMNIDRTSSYNSYKGEVDRLLSKADNITEKTKEVLNFYMQKKSFHILSRLNIEFLNQDITNVKTLTSTFTKRGNKTKEFLEFDTNGKISVAKSDKKETKFEYQKGILKKIIHGEKTDLVKYDDDKMIIVKDLGGGKETSIISLKKGLLLAKKYLVIKDKRSSNMNYIMETKLEEKCLIRSINGSVSSKECFSKLEYPYLYNNTSYQDGEISQNQKIYFTKETGVLKSYFFNEKGDKKLAFQVYFNKNNLISKIVSANNKMKIEYTYTYFK